MSNEINYFIYKINNLYANGASFLTSTVNSGVSTAMINTLIDQTKVNYTEYLAFTSSMVLGALVLWPRI